MEFLKKSWSKMLLAVIALVGVIFMLILVFTMPEFNFVGACPTIALLLFFIGMLIYYVVKIFEIKKLVKACILLVTGILTTVFLTIGFAGFSKDSTKAEGPLGNAYQYYSTVGKSDLTDGEAGVTALQTAREQIAVALTVPMANGGLQEIASKTPNQVLLGGPNTTMQQLVDLGLGDVVLSNVPAALDTVIAGAQAQLADGRAQIKKADYVASTIMYFYVAMFLSFGLVPVVKGAKKLCKSVCKCEKPATATK